jgi:acyl-CoA synthetase (NDP forming)
MSAACNPVDSVRGSAGEFAQAALASLFEPKTVAVFGISSDPAKLGNVILGNIITNGFRGHIYGIGRVAVGQTTPPMVIDGATIVASFDDIHEIVDIALFAVPASGLLDALRAVPPGRVKLAVAIASGFSEVGEAGRRKEEALREYCANRHLSLVGPNCQGVVVPHARLQMTFSPMYSNMLAGPVAIISQSGAMGGYMANRLMQRGIGLSCFISSGNETSISTTDYIAALNCDQSTRVILCYLEQITDGRRFASVVRNLDPAKRLVVVKSGRSPAGAAAISSHTGAIAGDDKVVDGVFRQLGIIRARDSGTAVDAVTALSAGKVLSGHRIGILSVAGGLAVELADLLEMRGFEVPEFDSNTLEKLKSVVPEFGATRNPIDLTGAVLTQETLFEDTLQTFSCAINIDGFAVISTYIRNPRYAHAIVRLFRSTDKPLIVCWTGSVEQTPESLAILAKAGVPVYDNTARAANAFCALRRDPTVG